MNFLAFFAFFTPLPDQVPYHRISELLCGNIWREAEMYLPIQAVCYLPLSVHLFRSLVVSPLGNPAETGGSNLSQS